MDSHGLWSTYPHQNQSVIAKNFGRGKLHVLHWKCLDCQQKWLFWFLSCFDVLIFCSMFQLRDSAHLVEFMAMLEDEVMYIHTLSYNLLIFCCTYKRGKARSSMYKSSFYVRPGRLEWISLFLYSSINIFVPVFLKLYIRIEVWINIIIIICSIELSFMPCTTEMWLILFLYQCF